MLEGKEIKNVEKFMHKRMADYNLTLEYSFMKHIA